MIKDGNHPIPAQMYQGFEANGVQIVLEVRKSLPIFFMNSIPALFSRLSCTHEGFHRAYIRAAEEFNRNS